MAHYEIYVIRFEGDDGFPRRIVEGEAYRDAIVDFHRQMIERFKDKYPHARVVCNRLAGAA